MYYLPSKKMEKVLVLRFTQTQWSLAMALSIAYQNSPELRTITEMALAAVEAGMVDEIEVEKKEVTIKTEEDA